MIAKTRWGLGIAAALSPDVIQVAAAAAESLGYDSFWVNDTPAGDGLTALTHAAGGTSNIDLGVGVIPLSRRTPESIIEQLRSLSESGDRERADGVQGAHLPLDRLLLGVGSAVPARMGLRESVAASARSKPRWRLTWSWLRWVRGCAGWRVRRPTACS
jgi:Luciferase-like monooxygenase